MTTKTKSKKRTKHAPTYVALGGHSDAYKCSCGWQSEGYWDYEEGAWNDWLLHAYDTKTKIEDKDHKRQDWMVQERDMRAKRIMSRSAAQGFVGSKAFGKPPRKL